MATSFKIYKEFDRNDQKYLSKSHQWDLTVDSATGDYLWLFSKGLYHDPLTGLPKKTDVDKLLYYIDKPSIKAMNDIKLSGCRLLEDLAGGLGHEPIGASITSILSDRYIDISSKYGVMETMEVYCMSLLRDMRLSDLTGIDNLDLTVSGVNVNAILDILNSVQTRLNINGNWPVNENQLVTLQLLFRGDSPDESTGHYLSQFLIQDIPFCGGVFTQKYKQEFDSIESSTLAGYINIQNGSGGKFTTISDTQPSRITTLRGIGSLVHKDPAYGLYFNAALIALGLGYKLDCLDIEDITSNFLDTGGPDLLSTLGMVTRGALRVAWHSKWDKYLKIRPEVAAGRLAYYIKDPDRHNESFHEWANWFDPRLISRIRQHNLTVTSSEDLPFLPLIYPEGSPTHPSMPAGHAVVAGACVTILKAFFKTHQEDLTPLPFNNIQQVSDDDNSLISIETSGETINGEFNKLASNVALGRNLAGVHYRSDGKYGIRMGEKYAISILKEMTKTYYPKILHNRIKFSLQTFDAQFITIKKGKVTYI